MTEKNKTVTAQGNAPEYYITRAKGALGERKEKLATLHIEDLWYNDAGPVWNPKIIDVWHLAHDLKRELLDVVQGNAPKSEGWTGKLLDKIVRLQRQRDELLAFAKSVASLDLAAVDCGMIKTKVWKRIHSDARAAIANAERK